jgi:hypothetical protein
MHDIPEEEKSRADKSTEIAGIGPERKQSSEFRSWLLSASVLTCIAAISLAHVNELFDWGGLTVLVGLGTLPFIAEAWIQFQSWWRRLLWIASGIIIGLLVLEPPQSLKLWSSAWIPNFPSWAVAPLYFLLPACLETIAAWGQRKRAWVWLIITPALFGFWGAWMIPILYIAEATVQFIDAHLTVAAGVADQFNLGAAIFGAVLFTRALTGIFIASRKTSALPA